MFSTNLDTRTELSHIVYNGLGIAEGRELKAQKLNRMITVDNSTKVHSRSSSPAFGNAVLWAGVFEK